MRRILAVGLTALFIVGLFGTAHAVVVLNSSFESWSGTLADADFDNWSEGGDVGATTISHSGTYAATLLPGSTDGSYASVVSSPILGLDMGLYEFGVWTQMWSATLPTGPETTWPSDKAGITFDVRYSDGGTPPASYIYLAETFHQATGWHAALGGGYETDWFLISGSFDVTRPIQNVDLNISLQNYWTVDTYARVDDAYLNKVPEPSTLLLLGSGLIGLVGYRRMKRMA